MTRQDSLSDKNRILTNGLWASGIFYTGRSKIWKVKLPDLNIDDLREIRCIWLTLSIKTVSDKVIRSYMIETSRYRDTKIHVIYLQMTWSIAKTWFENL